MVSYVVVFFGILVAAGSWNPAFSLYFNAKPGGWRTVRGPWDPHTWGLLYKERQGQNLPWEGRERAKVALNRLGDESYD